MSLESIFDRLLQAGERGLEAKIKYEQAKQSLKIDDKVADFATQRYTPSQTTQPGVIPADPMYYLTQAEPQNIAQRSTNTGIYSQMSQMSNGISQERLLMLLAAGLAVYLIVK